MLWHWFIDGIGLYSASYNHNIIIITLMGGAKSLNQGGRVWSSPKVPFIFKYSKGIAVFYFLKSYSQINLSIQFGDAEYDSYYVGG